MKKVLLLFVAVSTMFVGCKKDDEPKKEEKKNYPENIKYSVWQSNTISNNGMEGKMTLNFRDIDVDIVFNGFIQGDAVKFISIYKPSFTYTNGKGKIVGQVHYGNGKMIVNGKETVLYTDSSNRTYFFDINGNLQYLNNAFSPNYFDDEFSIEGNVLKFSDGTEFIRK